jgi:hypothetical protein
MLVLTPAHGRDYNTLREAKKDFYDGKDFIVKSRSSNPIHITINDLPANRSTVIEMRYSKGRNIGLFIYNPAEA